MSKRMFAALAATLALAVGLVAPATSGAAKAKKVRAAKADTSLSLSSLCNALGLRPLLNGLDVNLTPIIRVQLSRVCED